jgi:hypothetical protein
MNTTIKNKHPFTVNPWAGFFCSDVLYHGGNGQHLFMLILPYAVYLRLNAVFGGFCFGGVI